MKSHHNLPRANVERMNSVYSDYENKTNSHKHWVRVLPLQSLTYLRSKSAIFFTLSITRPKIRYPVSHLIYYVPLRS